MEKVNKGGLRMVTRQRLIYSISYYWHTPLSLSLSLSLCLFQWLFSRWTWVSWCQNVSILDVFGAKADGGGSHNWSYKTCKASVKPSPPTNKPSLLQARCPSCHPTNSVRALKEKYHTLWTLSPEAHLGVFQPC